MRHVFPLAAVVGLSACGGPVCSTGAGQPMVLVQLFFGREMPGGRSVTEPAWKDFLAREVTVRFPAGLTVLDGYGQWRSAASSPIDREKSTIVEIVTPQDSETDRKLSAIRQAYEARFEQEAVGQLLTGVCADFGP